MSFIAQRVWFFFALFLPQKLILISFEILDLCNNFCIYVFKCHRRIAVFVNVNYSLLTENGKFNKMANLLADENDVSIKVATFNG